MQNNRWLQALIVLLTIIAALFLLGQVWLFLIQFSNIILLFFLSWLLAFILRPIARWLTSHGLPYIAAVAIVYVSLALTFIIGGFFLVPIITEQIARLMTVDYNQKLNDMAGIVDSVQKTLISWGVRDVDINKFYTDLAGQVQSIGMNVLSNTLSVLQSVATLVLQLVLVLLLSFYFMKDSERIFGGMLTLMPPRWRDEARLLAVSVERSFGAFVRGQLLFAAIYAVFTAVVMMIFKLDYLVIASIVAGLCMIIPLVGNFLAFVPPLLVCLLSRPADWLWLLVVLFVAQSFMMNVVGPRIMSQAIGIHPLYVMGAMLMGGQVFGFWGALFGIPLAGTINLVGRPLMKRVRHQVPLYQEVEGSQLGTRAFITGPLRSAIVDNPPSPPASSSPVAEEEAIASEPVPPSTAPRSAPQRTPLSTMELEDDDPLPPRQPTLSGRAWHMTWLIMARAYRWVGTKAHVRPTRQ